MAVDKVTPNERAKAAAARDHACDLLINAFNHLDKLDAQSAGDIVDAIIEAADLAPTAHERAVEAGMWRSDK